ncbi:MAG TPA: 2-isopropylmalate synthase [Vicinamibacterales bacterium]|jgi:2-isopropylmalate synthase|nr:2-isopropylmalate synthase [Vicinamibacterales bacterium]
MSQTHTRVIVFDTTLRDGEQAPGFSMDVPAKLEMARALDALGVDIIEAGFPIASPADAEGVREVSREIKRPVIAALARCRPADIDEAARALEGAARKRIHTFLATSDLHLEKKLRMTRDACLAQIIDSVSRARQYTDDVEFSAEDATRSDRDFLCRVVEAAITNGATTINLPDTVGFGTPEDSREFFEQIIGRVSNADKAIFSAHCHDDLGLAVANSIAAVQGGVRQIECTINGIGERAGNASLEELVMAFRVRQDRLPFDTGVRSEHLFACSQLLSTLTDEPVQSNKAIVGRNAFAHEAGIHQDGMLKDKRTYEIMRPEDVGRLSNQLVLGRHSGRHAVAQRCEALGFGLTAEEIAQVYHAVITMGEHRKSVGDGDLKRLVDRVRSGQATAV